MRVGATAPAEAGLSARELIARRDRKAADKAVAARVDGKLVDLSAPAAPDAAVSMLITPEGISRLLPCNVIHDHE